MTLRSRRYFQRKKEEKLEDETRYHWLCSCGNYEESGLHCSICGNEPPWGCDCSFCNEPDDEEDEYFYDESEQEFQRCSDCDGHDACEDFGCAIKLGIDIYNTI